MAQRSDVLVLGVSFTLLRNDPQTTQGTYDRNASQCLYEAIFNPLAVAKLSQKVVFFLTLAENRENFVKRQQRDTQKRC